MCNWFEDKHDKKFLSLNYRNMKSFSIYAPDDLKKMKQFSIFQLLLACAGFELNYLCPSKPCLYKNQQLKSLINFVSFSSTQHKQSFTRFIERTSTMVHYSIIYSRLRTKPKKNSHHWR